MCHVVVSIEAMVQSHILSNFLTFYYYLNYNMTWIILYMQVLWPYVLPVRCRPLHCKYARPPSASHQYLMAAREKGAAVSTPNHVLILYIFRYDGLCRVILIHQRGAGRYGKQAAACTYAYTYTHVYTYVHTIKRQILKIIKKEYISLLHVDFKIIGLV